MNELITEVVDLITPIEGRTFLQRLFKSERATLASNFEPGDIFLKMRDKQYYDDRPSVIFFYYLKFENDGTLVAQEYTYFNKKDISIPDPKPDENSKIDNYAPIVYEELSEYVVKLVNNARTAKNSPTPNDTADFRNLVWQRVSHVVIFMDNENWEFYRRSGEKYPPILFVNRFKDSDLKGNPNFSFFDGQLLDVDFKDSHGNVVETKTCLTFINYLKKDVEGRLKVASKADHPYFNFNLLFDVRVTGSKNTTLTVIFDPGGTNLGPPLEP